MSEIVETMKKIAENETNKIHVAEIGTVTSIFPHAGESDKDNYECSVKLKNKDLELRKVPVATQTIGLTSIPRVGDLVLINFVDGDLNYPVIVGRLYNDQDRPPENKAGEMVFKPPYDKDASLKRFHLEFPGGVTFTMTDDSIIAVAGKTKINVKADGDITIESNAKIDLKASGDLSLSGSNVKIESQQSLQIKAGTDAKIQASTMMDLKSDGPMNVNASANMAIKGAIVQIN